MCYPLTMEIKKEQITGGIHMKALNKVTRILARILEIAHIVGVCIFAVMLVCCIFAPNLAEKMIAGDPTGEDVVYGFHFTLTNASGAIDRASLTVFAVAGVILLGLMALVFRNVYRIIKTSEGGSPFRPDVIVMLRRIGYYAIAVPVVGLVMSIVGRLAVGPEFAETSVDFGGVFMGLLVLWLTQAFTHGAKLEQDSEGLI